MMFGTEFRFSAALLVEFLSIITWMTSVEALPVHESPYGRHHLGRMPVHPARGYENLIASSASGTGAVNRYATMAERYPIARQSGTSEYYLNALNSAGQSSPANGRRYLPIPWAELVLGMDGNSERDHGSTEETLDDYDDEDYVTDEEAGFPVMYGDGFVEEWPEQEDEEAVPVQRGQFLDDPIAARNADLYGNLMLRYFLRKMGQKPQEEPFAEMPPQVQRRNGPTEAEEEQPEEDDRSSSTQSPANTDAVSSTVAESSPTTSTSSPATPSAIPPEVTTPLPPKDARAPAVKKVVRHEVPTPIIFTALQRGQKEFPILRPASEHRRPPPTWPSLVDDVSSVEEQKNAADKMMSIQSAQQSRVGVGSGAMSMTNSLRESGMPADILMAQLDSLKTQQERGNE